MSVLVRIAVVVVPVVAFASYWVFWGGQEDTNRVVAQVPPAPLAVEHPAVEKPVDLSNQLEEEEGNNQAPELAVESVSEVMSLPPLLPVAADLNHSDAYLFSIFEQMSPKISQWLVPDELVRKWVLAIDLMAEEKLPQRHRPLGYPAPVFKVQKTEVVNNEEFFQALVVNQQRYSELVNTAIAIDPRTVGRYYREWKPLLEQAYGELGKAGQFNERMNKAIDNILKVSAPPASAELKQPHVLYEYVDRKLESKSSLEKAVWRLGDENRIALQAYLRELKFYL